MITTSFPYSSKFKSGTGAVSYNGVISESLPHSASADKFSATQDLKFSGSSSDVFVNALTRRLENKASHPKSNSPEVQALTDDHLADIRSTAERGLVNGAATTDQTTITQIRDNLKRLAGDDPKTRKRYSLATQSYLRHRAQESNPTADEKRLKALYNELESILKIPGMAKRLTDEPQANPKAKASGIGPSVEKGRASEAAQPVQLTESTATLLRTQPSIVRTSVQSLLPEHLRQMALEIENEGVSSSVPKSSTARSTAKSAPKTPGVRTELPSSTSKSVAVPRVAVPSAEPLGSASFVSQSSMTRPTISTPPVPQSYTAPMEVESPPAQTVATPKQVLPTQVTVKKRRTSKTATEYLTEYRDQLRAISTNLPDAIDAALQQTTPHQGHLKAIVIEEERLPVTTAQNLIQNFILTKDDFNLVKRYIAAFTHEIHRSDDTEKTLKTSQVVSNNQSALTRSIRDRFKQPKTLEVDSDAGEMSSYSGQASPALSASRTPSTFTAINAKDGEEGQIPSLDLATSGTTRAESPKNSSGFVPISPKWVPAFTPPRVEVESRGPAAPPQSSTVPRALSDLFTPPPKQRAVSTPKDATPQPMDLDTDSGSDIQPTRRRPTKQSRIVTFQVQTPENREILSEYLERKPLGPDTSAALWHIRSHPAIEKLLTDGIPELDPPERLLPRMTEGSRKIFDDHFAEHLPAIMKHADEYADGDKNKKVLLFELYPHGLKAILS